MGGPFGVVVVLLLIVGVCIQVAITIHHKYAKRTHDTEKGGDDIAAELELQLSNELNDAIKSSITYHSETNGKLDGNPAPYSQAVATPRVSFVDTTDDVTSWNAFKLDGRAKLKRLARTLLPKPEFGAVPFNRAVNSHGDVSIGQDHPVNGTSRQQPSHAQQVLPLPVSNGSSEVKKAVLVNAKQYNRILKRRLTRQLIEDYFRSRPAVKTASLRDHGVSGCMRRPRGPGGRFLTPEEIRQMEVSA